MTVDAWTRTPAYTVSNTGPYAVTHPYRLGAIRVSVMLDTGLLALAPTEFTVTPEQSDDEGNVFLSPAAVATHAGRQLIIDRVTPDEQGWLGVQGEREAGLEAQLDRIVQANQELRMRGEGALRIRGVLDAFDWADGTVPLREGSRVRSGPTAAQIEAAETFATQAAAARDAAAASAAEALQRELSMLRDRGDWGAGIFYSASDIFTWDGRAYITQTAHFATTVAADQAAGRIRVFVEKGAPGPGSGDMLNAENLSGLANVAQARTNLGLGALAVKALAAFGDIDPVAVITALETLAANKTVENALPTAKAVADYVDAATPKRELLGPFSTLSGNSVDVSDLPSWPTRVNVHLDNIGLTSTTILVLRIGPAAGTEATGYTGSCAAYFGNATAHSDISTGFGLRPYAGGSVNGAFRLTKLAGNKWHHSSNLIRNGAGGGGDGSGEKTIAGPLARLRLLLSAGNYTGGQFWVECLQ